MQKQYAMTQVCQLSLSRHEIERVILDNLLKQGGDPSYDFATDHPIFIWDKEGGLSVRFVQAAVVAKEESRWFTLKPVKTEAEIEKRLRAQASPATPS
jgi:hypothetical protein